MAQKLSILNRINRPSRYLGGELGSISKDPALVDVSMALAFPDVYEVGMSHLGFAILYHVLNSEEQIAAERVYAPWPDMEEQLRRNNLPLASLETDRPLGDFDIVGFTLQYELSYSNLLNMLDLAGIPRRRSERNAGHPLIVVGGPCAFNPEPLADFIDCAVIGDAEEAVVELCNLVRDGKKASLPRAELLVELGRIAVQQMRAPPRDVAADPLRLAAARGHAAIERDRRLGGDERHPALLEPHVGFVQPSSFVLQLADGNVDSGLS